MVKKLPKLSVIFYSTGVNEPVRDWIMDEDEDTRKEVGEHIKAVQFGWPLGLPLCDHIHGDIWEVRIKFATRIARVLFCIDESKMVLLHVFVKKTPKTPKHDLDLAKERLSNYWRNK